MQMCETRFVFQVEVQRESVLSCDLHHCTGGLVTGTLLKTYMQMTGSSCGGKKP